MNVNESIIFAAMSMKTNTLKLMERDNTTIIKWVTFTHFFDINFNGNDFQNIYNPLKSSEKEMAAIPLGMEIDCP